MSAARHIPPPPSRARAGAFLYQALMEAGYPRLANIANDGPAMLWMMLDDPPTLDEVAATNRAFDLWFHLHPEEMDVEQEGWDRMTVEEWHASIHETYRHHNPDYPEPSS